MKKPQLGNWVNVLELSQHILKNLGGFDGEGIAETEGRGPKCCKVGSVYGKVDRNKKSKKLKKCIGRGPSGALKVPLHLPGVL